jgi:hypothetical protein
MHISTTILLSTAAICLISSSSAATLEKRCSLKRESITFKNGLVCCLAAVVFFS